MSLRLVMPMSGQGVRFQQAGYSMPKPLVPVNGTPMVQRLLSSFPKKWHSHFILADNHESSGLRELLGSLRPQSTIEFVKQNKQGPGYALLQALKSVPDEEPILVTYCDYGMVWDAEAFEQFVRDSQCDACVIAYRGFHPHYLYPETYAYCRMQGDQVVEVKEKGSFTENRQNEFASSGGYYFRSAWLLREALEYQLAHQILLNGEAYTSLTVEALIQMSISKYHRKADVRVFEIPKFFQWGTPRDVKVFEYWEKAFLAHQKSLTELKTVDQVLMPMAGFGSRFKSITEVIKPLILIDGIPMYRAALASLPAAKSATFVFLKQYESDISKSFVSEKDHAIVLAETPAGQALSTQAGLGGMNPTESVLVSSCDHGIVLSKHIWTEFLKQADQDRIDAAIFTVRGYPGADRRPQAYAYVDLVDPSQDFSEVKGVSVKKPLSATPSRDALLVGTFWFRSVEKLNAWIQELESLNLTVNGELYLDSVFEVILRSQGKVVQIPLDGYLCWGDPDSLNETQYWSEVFMKDTP